MSHLADIFATFVFWMPGLGTPSAAVMVCIIFAGAGAVILGKFTSHIGFFTMPMNYLMLLVGALVGNWLFSGMRLPIEPTLQAPMLFALAGMSVMGLSMMYVLRRE